MYKWLIQKCIYIYIYIVYICMDVSLSLSLSVSLFLYIYKGALAMLQPLRFSSFYHFQVLKVSEGTCTFRVGGPLPGPEGV